MSFRDKLRSKYVIAAGLVLVGILVGLGLTFSGISRSVGRAVGLVAPAIPVESPEDSASPDVKAAIATAEAVQTAFRYVAETVKPSVVEIDVTITKMEQAPEQQFPWPFFFNGPPDQGQAKPQPQKFEEKGLGSGIIVRREGYTYFVLTNNHVAGSASDITVITNDGRQYKGSLVGKDVRRDIALVKFESFASGIVAATLGDSSALHVGDWTIAIGSPLGLVSSVTTGIVSALGRTGGPEGNISDFIQTDAAINRGNSGGALVDIRGEVVGINTWIASPSGGSIGLGFAIPINNAKKAIGEFIAHGKVQYGWLGASLGQIDQATADELGADPQKGAFVADIFRDSPASRGGLEPGDVVLSVNGMDVTGADRLVNIVGDLPVDKKARFVVLRDGKTMNLDVVIAVRKETMAADGASEYPGADVVSVKSDQIDPSALPAGARGVFVANIAAKSPADVIGLKPGDIITAVNDKRISTVGEFYRYLNDPANRKIGFTVRRDGQTLTTLEFDKP
ncbi:MAG: Do family serine endopeptidase [Rectinemataceae bacterium]